MQSLKNKTAVITGGSKGIGRVLAFRLAAEETNLVITARNEKDLMKTRVEILSKYPAVNLLCIPCDISKPEDVKELVRQVIKEFKDIHILVNNAALLTHKTIKEFEIDDWKKVLDVNVYGTFMLCKEVLPYMEKLYKTTGATIVNIASTSGRRGYESGSAYSASKFALSGLSESLFKEVRQNNIRVVTIYPSQVDTKIVEENKLKDMGKGIYMRAEDVADSIIFTLKLPQRALIKELEIWCTNP